MARQGRGLTGWCGACESEPARDEKPLLRGEPAVERGLLVGVGAVVRFQPVDRNLGQHAVEILRQQRADRIAAARMGHDGDAARLVGGVDRALQRLVGAETAAESGDELGRLFQILDVPFADRRHQDVVGPERSTAGDLLQRGERLPVRLDAPPGIFGQGQQLGVEIGQHGAKGARLRIGPVRLDTVDQHVPLATAPAGGDLDRGDDADAALRRPARHLRHRALGVVVGDGGHAEAATRQVIDQRRRRPGAVGGVGVQMEIDGVRRPQRQRLRRCGGGGDLVGGGAGRVCQGGSFGNAPIGATALLPGSLAEARVCIL